MYESLIRALLFRLEPETAHDLTLRLLQGLAHSPLAGALGRGLPPAAPVDLLGLRFPNRLGLAAGLDKNGDCIDGLGALGFGFLELGTVTPRPQPGNPRPRLFRLVEQRALINRMGFNNLGVAHLVERVRQRRYRGVVGINIGKNKDTPNEQALADYLAGLDAAWPVADYVSVNISSPNTPGLRALQAVESLRPLLEGIRARAGQLQAEQGRRLPVVVKIAPDLETEELRAMSGIIAEYCDGVIATNTTASRTGVESAAQAGEDGGLSGAPLLARATAVVRQLRQHLPAGFPIIAAGGICGAGDALDKLDAGADLIQIYTGLIYRGPALVGEILRALASRPAPGR